MISVGHSAKELRKSFGITQKEAAERLGVSYVHLCNVENDKSKPSPSLLARYREEFGVDIYVLAWCRQGDVDLLPPSVRKAARRLLEAWEAEMARPT